MKRFWLGVLAFAPIGSMIGYFVMFAVIFLLTFLLAMAGVPEDTVGTLVGLALFVWIWLGAFILVGTTIADMITFSIFACKNPGLEPAMKGVWVGAFLTFQMLAFPVYWWIYMRKPV